MEHIVPGPKSLFPSQSKGSKGNRSLWLFTLFFLSQLASFFRNYGIYLSKYIEINLYLPLLYVVYKTLYYNGQMMSAPAMDFLWLSRDPSCTQYLCVTPTTTCAACQITLFTIINAVCPPQLFSPLFFLSVSAQLFFVRVRERGMSVITFAWRWRPWYCQQQEYRVFSGSVFDICTTYL